MFRSFLHCSMIQSLANQIADKLPVKKRNEIFIFVSSRDIMNKETFVFVLLEFWKHSEREHNSLIQLSGKI